MDINDEHVCMCNDGYTETNSGSDLKCTKNEKFEKIQAHCSPNQFRCNTGECIQKEYQCDGEADCRDHSDEASCRLDECGEAQFKGLWDILFFAGDLRVNPSQILR